MTAWQCLVVTKPKHEIAIGSLNLLANLLGQFGKEFRHLITSYDSCDAPRSTTRIDPVEAK